MVSLCWGVCKASRWRHRATVPAHRHACAVNTVTLQLVAVADVFYIFNSTVVDWTCFFIFYFIFYFFFAAARYPISLLHTALVACIMFSMSHDFRPDLLWILLADILKKQFIKFINPVLLLVSKRENQSAELQTLCCLCRHRWVRKALTVVVCSKSSEPSFPEII